MTTEATDTPQAVPAVGARLEPGVRPQRWTGIVQAHCSGGFVAVGDYMAAMDEVERFRAALQRIARWHGEFPATGRYWDEPENTRPMSYSACNGSNGERDFMRQVALDALGPNVGAKLETTAAPK